MNLTKQTCVFLSILSLFTLSSCAFKKRGRNIHREPASIQGVVSARTCSKKLTALRTRIERRKYFKNLILGDDFKELKRVFWNSYPKKIIKNARSNSRIYRMLKKVNGTTFVPYLYQSGKKESIDTFSTIFAGTHVTTDAAQLKDQKAAIEDMFTWVDFVVGHKARINTIMETGFEAEVTVHKTKGYFKGRKKLTKKDMTDEGELKEPVTVPTLIDDMVVDSSIKPKYLSTLKDEIDEKVRLAENTFASSLLDDLLYKSRIYKAMKEHALYYRRLEIALLKFDLIPENKINADQEALASLIREVLRDYHYAPRPDIYDNIIGKEIKGELWGALKFYRSKRIGRNAKYSLPSIILSKAEGVSPAGFILKWLSYSAIVGTSAAIYQASPRFQYMYGLVMNTYNDLMVDNGRKTSELNKCALSQRATHIENTSTMNNFTNSHLSRFSALEKINKTRLSAEESEYVRKRTLELQAICGMLRLEYGYAAEHHENKELLKSHGYRFTIHQIFVELINKHHPKGDELGVLVYSYLYNLEVRKDKKVSDEVMGKILKLAGQNFVDDLSSYINLAANSQEAIRNGSFYRYHKSYKGLIEYLEE
jgi:hypothetical protein